jgi:hypothetical protein
LGHFFQMFTESFSTTPQSSLSSFGYQRRDVWPPVVAGVPWFQILGTEFSEAAADEKVRHLCLGATAGEGDDENNVLGGPFCGWRDCS